MKDDSGISDFETFHAVASPQRHPLIPVAKAGMPIRSALLPGITKAVVATRANPAATSSAIQCVIPSMTISPEVFALDDLKSGEECLTTPVCAVAFATRLLKVRSQTTAAGAITPLQRKRALSRSSGALAAIKIARG